MKESLGIKLYKKIKIMTKRKITTIKECDVFSYNAVIKKPAYNNDIPKGDIFDPLVQKLIAKRCEDRYVNMLFELEKPDKDDIKYVVFTHEGARLYFTSKCKQGALVMLKCRETKSFQYEDCDGLEQIMYLASNSNGSYLFNADWEGPDDDDEQIDPCYADMPIIWHEKVTGLAEALLTGIESDDCPSLLDELKSEGKTGTSFKPEYADYMSELYRLGAKGMLEDIVEWYGEKGNEEDADYIEDLAICFSALYSSNLIRGLEAEKAYQIATDSLSFCLGKKIDPSEFEIDFDCENFSDINEDYSKKDILSWGLSTFVGGCNAKDAETCKKLLVGYNELYALEGYYECNSRLFAFSRVLSTKSFPEKLLLDCYEEVFDDGLCDDEEINEVLDLYK